MTQEEVDLLSDEQKDKYRDQMDRLAIWKKQFYKELFADNEQVLDTDYASYVIFYGCSEYMTEINANGQPREQIEQMLLDETLEEEVRFSLDQNYTQDWYHSIYASIFVRDLKYGSKGVLQD